MTNRVLRSLPVVIVCVALAVASREPIAPVLVAVFALASALVSGRIPLDRATQRLTHVVIVVLTVVGIRASGMPLRGPHLGALSFGIALAPLLIVSLRLWIEEAEWSPRVDLAFMLVSLLAIASARPGLSYLAFVVAFVTATIMQRRAEDPLRLAIADLQPRTYRHATAVVVSAVLIGVAVTALGKAAYIQAQRRFEHAIQAAYDEGTGLSDNFRLGKMSALLASDAVVLRVSGATIDRVRGFVLDEYGGGRWTRANRDPAGSVEVSRDRPRGGDVVEVRHIDPDHEHIFLPLEAREVATAQGTIAVNSLGITTSVAGDPNPTVWFRSGARDALMVAPPHPEDLLMPHSLRPKITPIAKEWTRGADSPEKALELIQNHLDREYTYSLEHDSAPGLDPVLDFLTVSRKGHCEYFASALALLARAIDIPTRVVLGYRVAERNPYWASYVVRRKNAHAWVEAWIPNRGWITVDPTPMTELPQDLVHEERGTSAVFETIAVAWEKAETWLAQRSVLQLAATAVFGVLVFAFLRWRRARAGRRDAGADDLGFTAPPITFVELEESLARRGLGRARSESIEGWAARLAIPEVSDVLHRYAGARYGNETNPEIDAALRRASRWAARKG